MAKVIGAIENQPDNINTLHSNKFRFVLRRLPHVQYFTDEANLPGLRINSIARETPFRDKPYPGTKLEFEQNFTLKFYVDEDLQNYHEIRDWMVGLGSPDTFRQYKTLIEESSDTPYLQGDKGKPWSDASLIIHTSHHNKNWEITFQDIFPISLSGLTFSVQTDTVEIQEATVVFAYSKYEFVGHPDF